MFTFENTKEATHLRWSSSHNKFHFFLSDGFTIWEDGDRFPDGYDDGYDEETTKLSYPAGERKEDHTDMDGVVTYALTYKLDHLTKEATHYNAFNQTFHKRDIGKYARVLGWFSEEWLTSDCTTNAELDSDEFWKLDGKQIIEPVTVPEFPSEFYQSDSSQVIEPVLSETWLIDQLKGNPLKSGEVIEVNEASELPWHLLNEDAPVFTQSMADAGEMPPIGAECLVKSGSLDSWYKGECIGFDNNKDGEFAVFAMSDDYPFPVRYAGFQAGRIKPIDNRTEGQKVRDKLSMLVSGYVSAGEECDIQHYVDELMQSFSITLNKE